MHLKLAVLNSGDVYEECEIFLHIPQLNEDPHTIQLSCCVVS